MCKVELQIVALNKTKPEESVPPEVEIIYQEPYDHETFLYTFLTKKTDSFVESVFFIHIYWAWSGNTLSTVSVNSSKKPSTGSSALILSP